MIILDDVKHTREQESNRSQEPIMTNRCLELSGKKPQKRVPRERGKVSVETGPNSRRRVKHISTHWTADTT